MTSSPKRWGFFINLHLLKIFCIFATMKYTYNELVSRVQNTLNQVAKDTFIPRRFILHILKSKIAFYTAQKLYDRSIFRDTNSYKWIECIRMKEESGVKCGVDLQKCETVSKSVKKLPELMWGKYGPSILMVTNIDGSKEYQVVSPLYYNSIKKKSTFSKFKGRYAIIYPDNHLYIPDSSVKVVNVLLLTFDEKCVDSSDCEGSEMKCSNYWDTDIEVPDKLSEAIIQETIKEVSMRIQIPLDANENSNPNIKGKEG